MQKIAAILMEHDHSTGTADDRHAEIQRIEGILRDWLTAKRADDPEATSGEFRSESREATGSFAKEKATHGNRSWRMLRLTEDFDDSRRFETSISITDTGMAVAVFVTLASGLTRSAITPVFVNPKCPRIVRSVLGTHDGWSHGATKIRVPNRVEGNEAGRALAREILSPSRTLPIIAIAEDDDEMTFPGLDVGLGKELHGLANVSVVDEGASWGLTEVLGKEWACYWGAVRVYWPQFTSNRHPLWTAGKLLESDEDSADSAARFQAQLRRMIMRVSALSVVRPREIDAIRNSAARARMQDLQAKLNPESEWKEFAETYADQNDSLRAENRRLEDELDRLRVELRNAEDRLDVQPPSEPIIEQDTSMEPEAGPQKGEIRFYKKLDRKGRDKMIHYHDCGHTSWQSSGKADKARKGLFRLERRDDWKTMLHCGKCTGGGVWKVVW